MADDVSVTMGAVDNISKVIVGVASKVETMSDDFNAAAHTINNGFRALEQAAREVQGAYKAVADELTRIGDTEAIASIKEQESAWQSLTATVAEGLAPAFIRINQGLVGIFGILTISTLGWERFNQKLKDTIGLSIPFIGTLTQQELQAKLAALANGTLGDTVAKTTDKITAQGKAVRDLISALNKLKDLQGSREDAIRRGDALALSKIDSQIGDLNLSGRAQVVPSETRGGKVNAGNGRDNPPIHLTVKIGEQTIHEQIYNVVADLDEAGRHSPVGQLTGGAAGGGGIYAPM